ncbi:MAG: hypothetical protein JXR75_00225 [Rhodobacteraceae bacterium]|nr:hypothetical protein [Paracoccaceae bacterium]
MKVYSPATAAYLARRGGSVVRVLVYLAARNRQTGEIETVGLWSGEADRIFAIGGQSRTYYRAAGVLQIDEIVSTPGTDVSFTTLRLCSIDERVIAAFRGYDPRFGAVEIHRALFDPDSGALIDAPERLFKGWIDGALMPVPAMDEDATLEIRLASANRALTQTLAFKKSDAALAEARTGDHFRRHVDVSGTVTVVWGERKV